MIREIIDRYDTVVGRFMVRNNNYHIGLCADNHSGVVVCETKKGFETFLDYYGYRLGMTTKERLALNKAKEITK